MKNNHETVSECTSDNFSGMITINDINKSWVAKWQRFDGFKHNGRYAITVEGEMPEHYIERMERAGKMYIPRDKPFEIN